VCVCPVTDLQGTGASLHDRAAVDPYALNDPLALIRHYVGHHDPTDPYLSPLYADLSGFPPVLIHASEDDVFLDDATRFAEKARHAGVDVTIKVWEKMWHIFHLSADMLPEGQRAVQEVCGYLHDRMRGAA
jgi:acetyl esterase/lipase